MKCVNCGCVNAAGQKFCGECGTRLEVVCAAYQTAATGDRTTLPYTGPRDLTPHEIWQS